MSLPHHPSNGYQTAESNKKKKRSLLFDRVQNDAKISDFRKYIHKNVNIYHTDDHKRTILMFTAQHYHLEVFTYLVDNYPKLIPHTDDQDMNIMHYIASTNTDDESMVELITNKKFGYNRLVWMRNKEGRLPKDIAKQSHNKHIIKSLESIMHDTWSEYSHVARHNNLQSLPYKHTEDASDSDDMDMDPMDLTNVISPHKPSVQNDASARANVPYRSISISSRKRRHTDCNDDAEDWIYCRSQAMHYKRRRLNGGGSGSYVGTTPQQPTLSPSPLPPLPPIGVSPFSLNMSDHTDSFTAINSPSSTNSSLSGSIPCTSFLSLSLPYNPPKLNRSRAVAEPMATKYQMIPMEDEIANRYYNGGHVTTQQIVFCQWFLKRFGANQFLPMLIEKGYDDLNTFMNLREDALPHGLWYCRQSEEIKTLNRNQVFGEYNNGICIGGIESNAEMDRFSDRLRELQLSEDMETMHECNREEDECDASEDDDL